MSGTITRRGKTSWRLKFEAERDPATGRRKTCYATVRGTKREAEAELTRLLYQRDAGTMVEPSKVTVASWLKTWLDDTAALAVAPKTLERYRELVDGQIVPHLGAHPLQRLKPAHVASWHATLLKAGSRRGGPLAPKTVGQAHRVLHKALVDAVRLEVVNRNVAAAVSPPKVDREELEILSSEQIRRALAALAGHQLQPVVALALATGARRGELLAIRWSDIDMERGRVRIERSLEQTKGGLRMKPPKTAAGRRTITVPASAVEALRAHRAAQLELRMAVGAGRLPEDALVFADIEGQPRPPHSISDMWRRFTRRHGLPAVSFHSLRHTHASALIAAGVDIVTVSRRLGHGSPNVTLSVYAHVFTDTDERAAAAIEGAMSGAV